MLNDLTTIVCKSYCTEGNENGAENVRFADPLCTYVATIAYSHYKYVDGCSKYIVLTEEAGHGGEQKSSHLCFIFTLQSNIGLLFDASLFKS